MGQTEMGQVTLYWLAGGGCSFLGLSSLVPQTERLKVSGIYLHTVVEAFNSKLVLDKSHILFNLQKMPSWSLLTSDDVSRPGHPLAYRYIISVFTPHCHMAGFSVYDSSDGVINPIVFS